MDWLHHPKFIDVRDSIIADLRRSEYRFRALADVVFLCGGRESPRRERLAQYLCKKRKSCLVFYAEAAWNVISREAGDANALDAEAQLAAFADMVAVIVESEGTFAELGAFAMSAPLRKKLFPILSVDYKEVDSFIRSGPIRWIDKDSLYTPSIWINQDRILEGAGEIEERLDRIQRVRTKDAIPLNDNPKHLLFLICDLVAVFGPCNTRTVEFVARNVIGEEANNVPLILALGTALRLLKVFSCDDSDMFIRPLRNGRLESFHKTRKYMSIPDLRARVLGVLLSITSGREALEKVQKQLQADGST